MTRRLSVRSLGAALPAGRSVLTLLWIVCSPWLLSPSLLWLPSGRGPANHSTRSWGRRMSWSGKGARHEYRADGFLMTQVQSSPQHRLLALRGDSCGAFTEQ